MITKQEKNAVRLRIHKRIREKISGTGDTPRISVFRSNCHLYVQVIDDLRQQTLVSSSTAELDLVGANIENAIKVGTAVGEKMNKAGLKKAVFDRGGYQYHGRVKALADAIRATGIVF